MRQGIIFDIKRFAVHDGPGIRTTVFFKGCLAHCWWCHNPESQSADIQTITKNNQLENFTFEDEEKVGQKISAEKLFNEIKKDRIFFDESGGGVTFSGGEPLMQPDFLYSILRMCREDQIHTTLDTTGYCSSEIIQTIYNHVDLFLYDIKIIDNNLHQKYTGLSNEPILSNLEFLLHHNKKVIIRFPLIPKVTDTVSNINHIIEFIKSKNGISEINILPFHNIATHKYTRFQIENKMKKITEPAEEKIKSIRNKFEQAGFKVHIGG